MSNILYLNNYMSLDIAKERHSENIFSQPANNKIIGILEALSSVGYNVTILSSGLANSKSGKLYPEKKERYKGTDVIYCRIIDLPLINSLTSIIYMYRAIKKQYRISEIDNIIFYNYKPEVAWAAYFAKKFLHIPITVEYEDGYAHVEGLSRFKAAILNLTEKLVSKKIDSAILVSSLLQKKYKVPNVVVRGVIDKNFLMECEKYHKTPNDKFTILYSGGLDNSRGINVLLESLRFLDIDCRIVITGKGNIEVPDDRVEFKGFIPYENVKELMKQADVLLQCQLVGSQFANASFPSKLFEYICTGNTIISSAMPDVMNFAGDAFVYYDNDDPKALADAIKKAYAVYGDNMDKYNVQELCVQNLPKQVGERIKNMLITNEIDNDGGK